MRLEALPTGVVFSMSSCSWFRRDGVNLEGPLQQPGVQQEQRRMKKEERNTTRQVRRRGTAEGERGKKLELSERERQSEEIKCFGFFHLCLISIPRAVILCLQLLPNTRAHHHLGDGATREA